MSNYPLNIQNDSKHVGEHFTKLVNDTNFDNKEKKKIAFLCNQMILHGKESGGRKYNANDIHVMLLKYICVVEMRTGHCGIIKYFHVIKH